MKKGIVFFLILLLCSALILPAMADVIYEPENSFYNSHRDECTEDSHCYVIPEKLALPALKSPKDKSAVMTLEAGTSFWTQYLYTDEKTGMIYGLTLLHDTKGNWQDLWVPLAGLAPLYNSTDFNRDYRDQFYTTEESVRIDLTKVAVRLWEYPGAETPKEILDNYVGTDNYEDLNLNTLFKDEDGLEWGYLGYWYGRRNCWICISDPEADSFPQRIPEVTPVPGAPVASEGSGMTAVWWIPFLLVIVIALITSPLKALFHKKRASEEDYRPK